MTLGITIIKKRNERKKKERKKTQAIFDKVVSYIAQSSRCRICWPIISESVSYIEENKTKMMIYVFFYYYCYFLFDRRFLHLDTWCKERVREGLDEER